MAIIANVNDISLMFKRTNALNVLWEYLHNAIDINSAIYKRILGLDCSNGRVEAKFDLGFGMCAIEQSYVLGGDICFESHKKYVDFQLVVFGSECMQVGQICSFIPKMQYNITKDVILYDNVESNVQDSTMDLSRISSMILYPQTLLVLFPSDIHAGGIKVASDIVFKSVIKVPILECGL